MSRAAVVALALAIAPAVRLTAQDGTVDEALAILRSAETLDDPAIGIDGKRSPIHAAFERLRAAATESRLRKLTDDARPVVRCYALRALLERKVDCDWQAILLAHATDTAEVVTFGGCCRSRMTCGDAMVETVRGFEVLDEVQWRDFGVELVRRHSGLEARRQALRTLTFPDGLLHEIRAEARIGDEPAAVVALARYHLAVDVPLLVEHLQKPEPFADNCRFLAAEISADARLLPALQALEPAAAAQLLNDNAYRLRFWLWALLAQHRVEAVAVLGHFLEHGAATDHKRRELAAEYAELLADAPSEPLLAPLRQEVERLLAAPPPEGGR